MGCWGGGMDNAIPSQEEVETSRISTGLCRRRIKISSRMCGALCPRGEAPHELGVAAPPEALNVRDNGGSFDGTSQPLINSWEHA